MPFIDTTATRSNDTTGTLKTFYLATTPAGNVVQPTAGVEIEGTWADSGAAGVDIYSAQAAECVVYEVIVANGGSQALWVGMVNSASTPSGGETMLVPAKVAPGENAYIYFPSGYLLSTGCQVVVSTTMLTVTLPVTNACKITVRSVA